MSQLLRQISGPLAVRFSQFGGSHRATNPIEDRQRRRQHNVAGGSGKRWV